MRKQKITIFLILGFVCVLIGFKTYGYLKRQYDNRLKVIHDEKYASLYENEYTTYAIDHTSYPKNIDELFEDRQSQCEYPLAKEAFLADNIGKDPFSVKGEYIQYIPLYERLSKQRVSFILLSAGIDGKMNNLLHDTDTVYMDSWWTQLKIYNYEETVLEADYARKHNDLMRLFGPANIDSYLPPRPDPSPFSLYDYVFGNKDYVIQVGRIPSVSFYPDGEIIPN